MTELVESALTDLGWPTIMAAWAERCASSRGAAAVLATPWVDNAEQARERVLEIDEARGLTRRNARLPLGDIADITLMLARVRKAGTLEAPELIAVATTGRALTRLRNHLRAHGELAPRLAVRGEPLADLGHVYHPILEAFDETGRLVDNASETLGPLRRTLSSIKSTLERRMDAMLNDDHISPYLQDSYYTQREDRYVLPIRTDGKGFVRGIVHGTSQSGQTLFIEPQEIVELNNRLKLAECDVAAEERRIMAQFSGWIAEEADGFTRSTEVAESLDLLAAAAILGDDLAAAPPVIVDEPRLALLHARHPLMLLSGRPCVANDLLLAAGQTLVVSGPNAGGKTVALKTAGLIALMIRCGLHVPVELGSSVGWFSDLRTDIGDAQDLEQDLSTFTGHITRLGAMLAAAKPGLLLLVDEIAVGTDPEQGAALAQAVLETLAERGVTAIVTTHYERLKVLGATDPRFANASVGFDLQRMEPTFKLHAGSPGSSGALAVARRTGLLGEIVDRAQALLGGAGTRVEELLASVADQRRRLEVERAAVLAELEDAEAERAAMRLVRERANLKLEQQTRAAHAEAMNALKAARRELEQVRADLRARTKQVTHEEVHTQKRRIAVVSGVVAKHEPARDLPPGRVPKPGELVVGAAVIVPSLGGRAVVASLPSRGRIDVRLGAMRATVDVDEVLIDRHRSGNPATTAPPKPAALSPSNGPEVALLDGQVDGRALARTLDTTLDVRGQRVDEALIALDRFVDEGVMTSRDSLFVIHGHGTGALRTALRAHVAAHPSISKWRAGEKPEGGDGITVMWLRD